MTDYGLMGLFNGLTALAAGALVWGRNRNDEISIAFFRFAICVSGWSICYALWQFMVDYQRALFFCRFQFFFCSFLSVAFFDFTLTITESKEKFKKLFYTILVASVVIAPTAFTALFIPNLKKKLWFTLWPVMGPTGHVYFIIFCVTTLLSFYLLFDYWAHSNDTTIRKRLNWVTVTLLLGFAGGSTNWFLDYDIPIPPIPNFFVGIFMLILAYGIIRLKLFDIQTLAELVADVKLSTTAQLTAAIIHEIKNPLYLLKNNIEVYREKLSGSKSLSGNSQITDSFINQISKNTDRALSIVEQFKQLNRRPSSSPSEAESEINGLIRQLVAHLDYELKFRNVNVDLRLTPEPTHVRMSSDEIEEALINIILNAIQASPAGGQVLISSERADGILHLSVADHGPGIAKDSRRKLFEPFYTTKPRGKGIGLGLYITKRLMEKNGGSIEAGNNNGKGAIFSLRFKVAK